MADPRSDFSHGAQGYTLLNCSHQLAARSHAHAASGLPDNLCEAACAECVDLLPPARFDSFSRCSRMPGECIRVHLGVFPHLKRLRYFSGVIAAPCLEII